MNLKPHHEHPLLQDYNDWRGPLPDPDLYRAQWYCPQCKAEIVGPPYEVGEYVVTSVYMREGSRPWGIRWRVYMRSEAGKHGRVPLFETTIKREALKHARQLERNREHISKALAGDARAVSENYQIAQRLKNNEAGN